MKIETLKAHFARDFIDLPEAAQLDNISWEAFQLRLLNNTSRFSIDLKSRQIAWSFSAAMDAVIDSILNPGTPHVFVSINLDESKEKVRYSKNILKAIHPDARPALLRESQTELEFENGSRIISHPLRPVRGKARARVYLDEMAHYPDGLDREVYSAALPATTKGDGYIRIGSSPLGARGLFWEIMTQGMRSWPGFTRSITPWWSVRYFSTNVQQAAINAPLMVTEDRVRAFGTPAIIAIYENMFLEDFQQEYECLWVDETTSWLSWDVIKRNQDPDITWVHATDVDQALLGIDMLNALIKEGKVEPVLVAGVDIGRHRHLTEIMVLGKSTAGSLPLRFSISLDRVEFNAQEDCLYEIVTSLPFTKVLIDQNGIGGQLAENLDRRTGSIAEGVTFTNQYKELWAVNARVMAEAGRVPIPMDRDIAFQFHSIKKKALATMNIFDTERNEKHHADKFWAWALAIAAGGLEPEDDNSDIIVYDDRVVISDY